LFRNRKAFFAQDDLHLCIRDRLAGEAVGDCALERTRHGVLRGGVWKGNDECAVKADDEEHGKALALRAENRRGAHGMSFLLCQFGLSEKVANDFEKRQARREDKRVLATNEHEEEHETKQLFHGLFVLSLIRVLSC
jgi:hypothetical protein